MTQVAKKGVFLMNRIGPSNSALWVADAMTGEERPLLAEPKFDYHGSISPDGEWVTFTSERNGGGNADIFRCRIDGSDLQPVVETPSVEDVLVMSPDGSKGAYVSTANGYIANIWTIDLACLLHVYDLPFTFYTNHAGVDPKHGEKRFYDEFAGGAGVRSLGLEDANKDKTDAASGAPVAPADEKKTILDLFKN